MPTPPAEVLAEVPAHLDRPLPCDHVVVQAPEARRKLAGSPWEQEMTSSDDRAPTFRSLHAEGCGCPGSAADQRRGTLARTGWAGFLQAAHEIANTGTFSRFEQLPNVDALLRDR